MYRENGDQGYAGPVRKVLKNTGFFRGGDRCLAFGPRPFHVGDLKGNLMNLQELSEVTHG